MGSPADVEASVFWSWRAISIGRDQLSDAFWSSEAVRLGTSRLTFKGADAPAVR